MKTYEFSIIASGLNPEDVYFEALFYDGGCDVALVSFQKGHIILDFAREANSIQEAIDSSVENVIAVGATVDRVEPDPLVSLSEIADRVGFTRAALTNYAKGNREKDFPAPVARVTTHSPLWDWSAVAVWLFQRKKISRDDAMTAIVVATANEVIRSGQKYLGPAFHERVKENEAMLAG